MFPTIPLFVITMLLLIKGDNTVVQPEPEPEPQPIDTISEKLNNIESKLTTVSTDVDETTQASAVTPINKVNMVENQDMSQVKLTVGSPTAAKPSGILERLAAIDQKISKVTMRQRQQDSKSKEDAILEKVNAIGEKADHLHSHFRNKSKQSSMCCIFKKLKSIDKKIRDINRFITKMGKELIELHAVPKPFYSEYRAHFVGFGIYYSHDSLVSAGNVSLDYCLNTCHAKRMVDSKFNSMVYEWMSKECVCVRKSVGHNDHECYAKYLHYDYL